MAATAVPVIERMCIHFSFPSRNLLVRHGVAEAVAKVARQIRTVATSPQISKLDQESLRVAAGLLVANGTPDDSGRALGNPQGPHDESDRVD